MANASKSTLQKSPLQGARNQAALGGSGAMFDGIAKRYDTLNLLMSFGMDRWWRKALLKGLNINGTAKVLDVATGTADVALSIAERYPRAEITGLDPSEGMLKVGRSKVRHGGADIARRVRLVNGDAQGLPFAAGSFDASCISFGIRNVPDREQGLREMVRVTRSGGRVAVLELGEPGGSPMGILARWHVHHLVPLLGRMLSGSAEYRYLQESIAAFPSPKDFVALMEKVGLVHVRHQAFAFGGANLFIGQVG